MIVDELVSLLRYEVRGESEVRRFKRGLDDVNTHAQGLIGTFGKLAIAVGGAMAAFGAVQGIKDFVGSITSTGAMFEGFMVQLSALEGSSERAEAAMDWITDFAVRTPLELQDVVQAYRDLRVFGLDPTDGTLKSLVDTMAAMGGSQEVLSGITRAFGQAMTKGRLQAEEMNQLTERGVPIYEAAAKAMGVAESEVLALASAGKIGREEIAKIIGWLGERFSGASDEYAKTWTGLTSNLLDSWTGFLRKIADSGYFDEVKARLQGVLDVMNRWGDDGTLDAIAQGISDALVTVMEYAEAVGRALWRAGQQVWSAIGAINSAFNALGGAIGKVLGIGPDWGKALAVAGLVAASGRMRRAIGPLAVVLGKLTLALGAFALVEDFVTALQGGESVIGSIEGMPEALGKLTDAFGSLSEAWTGLGLPAIFAPGYLEKLADRVQTTLGERIKSAVEGLAGAIQKLATALAAVQGFSLDGTFLGSVLELGEPQDPNAVQVVPVAPGAQSSATPAARHPGALATSSPGISIDEGAANAIANMQRMEATRVTEAVSYDQRQDNRDQSVHVSAPTTVHVQQPTAAPAAVGAAVAGAVGQAAAPAAARIAQEPAAP